MAELNIGFTIILNMVLCVILLMTAWLETNVRRSFLIQLNLSGVIGALSITIAALIAIEETGIIGAFTALVIGVAGFLGLAGLIIKKNSTHGSEDPNTYPFYITIITFVFLLSTHYSIYFKI